MTRGEVCPRCGQRGWLETMRVGGNTYLYCVHERREGGVRRRHKCYLGPVSHFIKPYIFYNVNAARRLARRILENLKGGDEGGRE